MLIGIQKQLKQNWRKVVKDHLKHLRSPKNLSVESMMMKKTMMLIQMMRITAKLKLLISMMNTLFLLTFKSRKLNNKNAYF